MEYFEQTYKDYLNDRSPENYKKIQNAAKFSGMQKWQLTKAAASAYADWLCEKA